MVWAAPPFHRRGERTIGEVVATASGDERVDIGHVLLAADVTVVDG
jgi:glycolate oxidase